VDEAGAPRVVNLRVESKDNPLGIDAAAPRLNWQLQSSAQNVMQSAYQIRVARNESDLRKGQRLTFDSGKVQSVDSAELAYAGPALQSRGRYYWQVRVWDEAARRSKWSEPAFWEMGLLSPTDWDAQWIEPQLPDDPKIANPSPLLRTEFELKGKVAQARAYVTSHGLYELHLNGQRVGDQLFTPGWTSFQNRLQYQTYDVTSLLREGPNALGAVLGDGWYRGRFGFQRQRNLYGDKLALLAQINIRYEDGRTEVITTHKDWKAAHGPIRSSAIYDGEVYDARLEPKGWSEAGFDAHDWSNVKVIAATGAALVAPAGPPVRRINEITPVRIFQSPNGETVADMGQNMVGWVRLRVSGPAGATVTLQHGEVLDGEGNVYLANLRTAEQKVSYTLKGQGEEVFEPHFTFQGFRYVVVKGYPGDVKPNSVTGIVIHSDMPVIGEFRTSNELVNQLQHNIVWGQKGNFLDVPTDCPQRDERLGWTGDAQAFSPTAAFNMDVQGFFTKWLGDLIVDQAITGAVPWVIPDMIKTAPNALRKGEMSDAAGAAGWADAATVIPWNLYLAYGDKTILSTQYNSMARWVAYQQSRAGEDLIWSGDFQFGDWLDYFSTSKNTSFGSTPDDLIATAYFAHSVDLLQRSAVVLGKSQDATRYADLLAKIRAAFNKQFVTADGRVGGGTQTAYVLALDFDLLPEAVRPLAAKRLAEDVRAQKHLTTGFLGTPHLLNVLSRFGYVDEAYQLLNRREFPSWLYPVTHGATTIWERWDGLRPDGTFQSVSMNSFNHYAYGAVGEWMYRVMAGINPDPAAPGYKHSVIEPVPGGGFTQVSASLETRYGKLSSAWEIKDHQLTLTVEVPPNTRATVRLPHAPPDRTVVEVGSGKHTFTAPRPR
jgi:alpha-L-rhamnosidase